MTLIDRMLDLHKQAVTERSHYYTGIILTEAMTEISDLRIQLVEYKTTLEEVAEGDPCGIPACLPEDPRCDVRRACTVLGVSYEK